VSLTTRDSLNFLLELETFGDFQLAKTAALKAKLAAVIRAPDENGLTHVA